MTNHGMSAKSIYWVWCGIKDRCRNPHNKAYKNYGGRGIKICERWISFENFLEDMGDKPTPKHQIDRINNNGNYELSNCRWATPKENCCNKAQSKRWVIDGRVFENVKDAASYYGVVPSTILMWADGYFHYGRKKFYPKRPGCCSIKKYLPAEHEYGIA